ncbi:uncharacterized protein LOC103317895 isoform X2 [Nasonia vitripennis]|uniref:Uncharacterized protein n=1 Tax=Nasonia vitripennis TaxID=7425 RepID=A0A7M7HDD0_NASVI|nr:uncharacterized protein LOC103317895 isoform X2 [Nasonia vitripennis]
MFTTQGSHRKSRQLFLGIDAWASFVLRDFKEVAVGSYQSDQELNQRNKIQPAVLRNRRISKWKF